MTKWHAYVVNMAKPMNMVGGPGSGPLWLPPKSGPAPCPPNTPLLAGCKNGEPHITVGVLQFAERSCLHENQKEWSQSSLLDESTTSNDTNHSTKHLPL